MKLDRGLRGKQEEPVLKELNDIRQILQNEADSIGGINHWDLTVHPEETFTAIAKSVLPEGKFTDEQIRDAYLELHLISELGGNANATYELAPTQVGERSENFGKSLLKFIHPGKVATAKADNRSRESTANAMFGNWGMLPVRDTPTQIADTQAALERFISKRRPQGQPSEDGMGLSELGNSGIRANLKIETPELKAAYGQNFNDIGRGYDRFSRNSIFNLITEFGHYVPVEKGGLDASSNGRMQAMGVNKATREKLGTQGALRAYGPTYFNNLDVIRKAGQKPAIRAYLQI